MSSSGSNSLVALEAVAEGVVVAPDLALERAPVGLTGWDMVLRSFSFLILVSPLGQQWNLRAWWRRALPPASQVARYGLVLMRLQVIAIYLQTALAKAIDVNPFWRHGEFLPYYLLSHNARWPAAAP